MRAGQAVGALFVACQLAVACLVLWIVGARMDAGAPFFRGDGGSARNAACLLGVTRRGASACQIAYGFGGASILLSAALAALLCLARARAVKALPDALVSLLGAGLWAAAALVFNSTSRAAYSAGLPGAAHRQWVVLLSWTGVALFGGAFITNLVRMWFMGRGSEDAAYALPTKGGAPPAPRPHGPASAFMAANAALYAPPPAAATGGYSGFPSYARPTPAAPCAPPPATGVPVSFPAAPAGVHMAQLEPPPRGAQPVVHSVRAAPQQCQAGGGGGGGGQPQYFKKDFGLGPDTYWGVAAARY